jgi:prevent-host-death family protein
MTSLVSRRRVLLLGQPADVFCTSTARPLENLPMRSYIYVYKRTPMTELTISEARKALLDLPEKLARTPERAVTITRRGQPVLAILPWEFYESIVETLEILGDPEMVAALRDSLEDLKRGRVVTHAEAKKRLRV